jgi:hypothetical protein
MSTQPGPVTDAMYAVQPEDRLDYDPPERKCPSDDLDAINAARIPIGAVVRVDGCGCAARREDRHTSHVGLVGELTASLPAGLVKVVEDDPAGDYCCAAEFTVLAGDA